MNRSQLISLVAMFACGIAVFVSFRSDVARDVAWSMGVQWPFGRVYRSSPRTQCLNRLRNISTAIQNYSARNAGWLPAAYSQPHGVEVSWRVTILPMLDSDALFDVYDQRARWFESPNDVLATHDVPGYRCPVAPDETDSYARTTYVVPTGPGTPMDGSAASLDQISRADGLVSTILVSERHHDCPVWSEPRDAPLPGPLPEVLESSAPDRSPRIAAKDDPTESALFSSGHEGIVNVMYSDGHGGTLSTNIDPAVLKALITYDDGEGVPVDF